MTSKSNNRAGPASLERLWQAFWDYQARRATVLMLEALDDRMLEDIGIRRSQIRPLALGDDATRPRSYDPLWWRRPRARPVPRS